MGKAEAGTPKALANKMKSKGLQKLRWYCQMCHKQCRDENGFKCHIMSESHQRQMNLFSENAGHYLDEFSRDFRKSFLDHLRRRHGTMRVHANIVYNEYVADKEHLHMNSTKWETLTGFIKYLGREGHCSIEETPKGWYMTYIDRDPAVLARQEALKKKERMSMTDEERTERMIEEQIERAKALERESGGETEATELQREADEKVTLALTRPSAKDDKLPLPTLGKGSSLFKPDRPSPLAGAMNGKKDAKDSNKRKSNLDLIMEMDQRKKAKTLRNDYWLHKNIIVKVLNKAIEGGKYYKEKGVVLKVHDKYVGEVEILSNGDVLRLDQAELETVVPKLGGAVLVVNGPQVGSTGYLERVDTDKFCGSVRIDGRVVDGIPYEDFCKLDG